MLFAVEEVEDRPDWFRFERIFHIKEEFTYNINNTGSLFNPDLKLAKADRWQNSSSAGGNLKFFFGEKIDFNLKDKLIYRFNKGIQDTVYSDTTSFDNYLQECYFFIRTFDFLNITVGRENIVSGIGYGWNPTDFLSDIETGGETITDIKRLREERKGSYELKLAFIIDNFNLTAIYFPNLNDIYDNKTNNKNKFLTKFSTNFLKNTVLDFLYYYNEENKIHALGTNIEVTVLDALMVYTEMAYKRNTKTIKLIGDQIIPEYGPTTYSFDLHAQNWFYDGLMSFFTILTPLNSLS